MARMGPAAGRRQIADSQRVASWKRGRHLAGGSLDRPHEGRGPVPSPLPGSKTPISLSSVFERDCVAQVPPVRCPYGDRLTGPERLRRARTDPEDRECREKPNHFTRIIAHGSA